jgi:hypothetical protein
MIACGLRSPCEGGPLKKPGLLFTLTGSLLGAFVFTISVSTVSALAASPKTKKLNSQLYEQDSGGTTASGKVKAIREIQEETEVFLTTKTGSGGPFVLPHSLKNRAALMNILVHSQKTGGPSVILHLDDQQRIQSVEETAAPSESSGPADKADKKWEL